MKILYLDKDLIVCIKPAGAVSTDEPGGMPERIRKAIGEEQEVRTVHRLDSVVAGLMVYALSREAASSLSRQIEDGSFVKEYLAALEGHPKKESGELHDYLRRSQKERKTYAVKKKGWDAQEASLLYKICSRHKDLSLVKVKLITGRTHQIRAQFSSRKLPLYGDRKYGSVHDDAKIALWSCHLHFMHPITGEEMDFSALPPQRIPWTCFKGYSQPYEEADVVTEFKRSRNFSDCPYAYACDGCYYQGMDYAKQLEKKQKLAAKHLKKYAVPEAILAAEETLNYRHKTGVSFTTNKAGNLICGFYSRAEKRVLKIDRCRIDHPKADEIMHTVRTLMEKHGIQSYDEKKKTGWLKQVQVRIAHKSGEALVVLIGSSEELASEKAIVSELVSMHPEIKNILLNIGTAASSSGLGKKEKVLYGPGYLEEEIAGIRVRIGSRSFFPAHPIQGEKSYRTALDYADLKGEERVLDAACGTGILSMLSAAKAKRVLGVDGNAEVIREASENVRLNGIENLRLVCADPGEYVEALVRSHDLIDVVFMDFAHSRIREKCVNAVCGLKPEKIVIISGDQEVLVKDLEKIIAAGYHVEKIQPVDVLPFAAHVETVVLMTKNK